MTIEHRGHEHEFEPEYGLPEALPEGERILWQGSPDFATVAWRVFHVRKAALYFALLLALRAANTMGDGGTPLDGLGSITGLALLALMGLAALAALAWATARTAVYTLTDQRLVMRIGIALTLTFNLPLRAVQAASLRKHSGGCADIVIELAGDDRIAWLHLWPHVRPWKLAQPQPMLRAVPDAARVAGLLAQAWSARTGVRVAAPGTEAPPQPASGAAHAGWQASPT
jgi:Bacterial PH domain